MNRRDFLKHSTQAMGVAMLSSGTSVAAVQRSVLVELTATRAVAAMATGEISAETYAGALLDRAAALPQLNAFRTIDPPAVLEAARRADVARSKGAKLGRLHGLPIPVKDSVNTKDFPTSNGTRALRDFRPKRDASIVTALLDDGAIVMGKTNLHELSFGWTSNNETFGAVRNPYDLQRTPGGSSGGSGAAVSARIAPLAIAEDTWASIRLPAAFCGLAGFRPSLGRYADDGIMPLTAGRFDQVGPVARSVQDLLLFDQIASTQGAAADAILPVSNIRIGIPKGFFWEGLHSGVRKLADGALAKLRDAGVTIVEVDVPPIVRESPDIAAGIISYEAQESIVRFLKEQAAPASFDQVIGSAGVTVKTLFEAMALPPNRPSRPAYEALLEKLRILRAQINDVYVGRGLTALAFPATMAPPPLIGVEDELEIDGQKVPVAAALARNMAVGSCCSLASLVLPVGQVEGGLPVAMEFAAPNGRDGQLLAAGLSFEKILGPITAPNL